MQLAYCQMKNSYGKKKKNSRNKFYNFAYEITKLWVAY